MHLLQFKHSNHKKIYDLLCSCDSSNIELAKMLALSSSIDIYAEIYLPYFSNLLDKLSVPPNLKWETTLKWLNIKKTFYVFGDVDFQTKLLNGYYKISFSRCDEIIIKKSNIEKLNLNINNWNFPSITSFNLTNSALTDVYINKSYIKTYSFCNNKLKLFDGNIESLNHIEYLNLSYNKLTDIPPIIWKMSNLKNLILVSNNIENITIPDNIENSNLEFIELSFNNIFLNYQIQELRNKLPNCLIICDDD